MTKEKVRNNVDVELDNEKLQTSLSLGVRVKMDKCLKVDTSKSHTQKKANQHFIFRDNQ